MKTNSDLEQIANALFSDYTSPRSEKMPRAIKLLRSIELGAWREARELVEQHGAFRAGAYAPNEALPEMDRLIQQLQLQ